MASVAIAAALTLNGCASVQPKRSAGFVVVPGDQIVGHFGLPLWTPSAVEISACEAALAKRLAREGRSMDAYVLRLGGVLRDGKRLIVGMAGDKTEARDYLKTGEDIIVLSAWGGGDLFFRFAYDVDRQRIVDFLFNAPL